MDFRFTDDQESFRDALRRFAQNVVEPASRDIDRQQRIPDEVMKGLAELGIFSMALPVSEGGSDASSIDLGIAAEELGRADFTVGNMPTMVGLVTRAAMKATPRVKNEILPALMEGRELVSFALTEPEAGSDASNLRCKAVRTADGYVLNGEKTSISNIGNAKGCVVLAMLEGSGVTAFYVPLAGPGRQVGLFEDLGCRGLSRGYLSLTNVEVPADALIGEEGGGFKLVMNIFDLTRTLIGLAAVGLALDSLDKAASYTRDRLAFGKPIAGHQGVSLPLAEHRTKLEAARWLCYRALWLRDAGLPHTSEAAMCKWWCVVEAREAIHTAMLVHGHSGYTTEVPLQQRLRDVIGMEWGDGTAQIQKLVVARSLIGREAVDGKVTRKN